jgi:hypothetical protein
LHRILNTMRKDSIYRRKKALSRVVLYIIRMVFNSQPTQDRVSYNLFFAHKQKSNVQDLGFSEIKSTQLSGDLTT